MPFHVPATDPLRILLVEDDDGDALLVSELLADSGLLCEVERSSTVTDAVARTGVDCVLLDLGLPDALGLEAVDRLTAADDAAPVIVLTGLAATGIGIKALAHGAQDYLVKADVGPEELERSIRYAVQRRRSEESERALYRSRVRAEENTRLERALLPVPHLAAADLGHTIRYVPGRDGLLGGDFYDLVEAPDGTVMAVLGDVAGHGVDEAALGASLRTAWRALVLAGLPVPQLLEVLDAVLESERHRPEVFATIAMLVVQPGMRTADLYLAGHHAPLLLGSPSTELPADNRGRALGLPTPGVWSARRVQLGPSWRLMLFTDGIIEIQLGSTHERLGVAGLMSLFDEAFATQDGRTTAEVVDDVMAQARSLRDGELADDVAVLVLEHPRPVGR